MPESPFDENDLAHFSYPRFNAPGRRRLRIKYRDVVVAFDWSELSGPDNLMRLVSNLPELMESAQSEMEVYNAMREMDSDIENLLGGNGPECEENEK